MKNNPLPKPISLSELRAMKIESPPWAVEAIFASGTINMLSAAPNVGKSWLSLYLAVCLATGEPLFGKFDVERQGVLVWNEEDGELMMQDRIKKLYRKNDDLDIHFYINKGLRLDRPTAAEIIGVMKDLRATFLVVDPLAGVHGANENESSPMNGVMDLLKGISREGITVLFNHHQRKGGYGSDDFMGEAARGSSAINAAVHTHMSLRPESNTDGRNLIRITQAKLKLGKKMPPFNVCLDVDDERAAFHYTGDAKQENSAIQAGEKVLAFLGGRGDWVSTKEILDQKYAGDKTTRESLRLLAKRKEVESATRKQLEEGGFESGGEGSHNELFYRAT